MWSPGSATHCLPSSLSVDRPLQPTSGNSVSHKAFVLEVASENALPWPLQLWKPPRSDFFGRLRWSHTLMRLLEGAEVAWEHTPFSRGLCSLPKLHKTGVHFREGHRERSWPPSILKSNKCLRQDLSLPTTHSFIVKIMKSVQSCRFWKEILTQGSPLDWSALRHISIFNSWVERVVRVVGNTWYYTVVPSVISY